MAAKEIKSPMHPLGPSELHVWHIASSAPRWSKDMPYFVSLLSEEELQRMRSFHFDDLQRSFIITRALCRLVLSRYVPHMHPKNWQFERNAFGRPHAVLPSGSPPIDFNISHARDHVVMAVATASRSVGVDIEDVRLVSHETATAAQFFSTTEQAELGQLPVAQRMGRFVELWTSKESYIKARGMGLSIPLDSFSVSIRHDSAADPPLLARLQSTPPDDDPDRWRIMLCDFAAHHKLALCAQIDSPRESLTLTYFAFEPGPSGPAASH